VIPEKVDNLAPKIANLIRVLDIPSLDAGDSVHLDFSHTKFFSNELTAILYSVANEWLEMEARVYSSGMSDKIKEAFSKNGFLKSVGIPSETTDTYNTTIPIFNGYSQNEYAIKAYLDEFVFNNEHWPRSYNNSLFGIETINSAIYEFTRNVNEHSGSNRVFMCGQFYPRNNNLRFCIVDKGKSIPFNIRNLLPNLAALTDCDVIEWATGKGNSTKPDKVAGGVGLYSIKQSMINYGEVTILSNEGLWKQALLGGHRHIPLTSKFGGTIIHLNFFLDKIPSYMPSQSEDATINNDDIFF
jgi:anti-sigma regulatory factor (Ser/Thr protein kinase)